MVKRKGRRFSRGFTSDSGLAAQMAALLGSIDEKYLSSMVNEAQLELRLVCSCEQEAENVVRSSDLNFMNAVYKIETIVIRSQRDDSFVCVAKET